MTQISSGNHASRCPLDLLCAWVSVPKGFAWSLSVVSGEWEILRSVAQKITWGYLLQGHWTVERNTSGGPSLFFFFSFIPHFKKELISLWSVVIYNVMFQVYNNVIQWYIYSFYHIPPRFFSFSWTFVFLGLYLWHMGVPRLGVQSEL